MKRLAAGQVEQYRDAGFLAVPEVLSAADLREARRVVDELVEAARNLSFHTDLYDLEPGHERSEPRVRRLKNPAAAHPLFLSLARDPRILDLVEDLLGPDLRLHGNKLNLKSAGYGSPVEWHQDFAFYPHTNDDILAVGVALDDCTIENSCMLMVPGSHRWPLLDHNREGRFVGAVDPAGAGVDLSAAVPVPVPAGGVTLHHCRTLHGSAVNRSGMPRRLYLLEIAAADAFPLLKFPGLDEFNQRMLRGAPPTRFRCASMEIRLPLPQHERQGSIYEVQSPLGHSDLTIAGAAQTAQATAA